MLDSSRNRIISDPNLATFPGPAIFGAVLAFNLLGDGLRDALDQPSLGELSEPFQMSQPAISKHLKVLERAGLIAKSTHAQWRLCRLEAASLREVADWMERYRRFWDESFSRLDEHLRHMQRDRERNER